MEQVEVYTGRGGEATFDNFIRKGGHEVRAEGAGSGVNSGCCK